MNFRERVFAAAQRIPYGKVTTYARLAARLGNPNKARAVGNALNKNTDTCNIPCHRIVRADGYVGGYAYGADNKIKRLREEGIAIAQGKIVHFADVLY